MDNFIVFPAIDLRCGKVVRLVQGDPDRQRVYDDDPASIAARWLNEGAAWLHVVNLDGAFGEDDQSNRKALREILDRTRSAYWGKYIQFGGGLRTLGMVEEVIELGVDRVVLGSMAATSQELVRKVVKRFGVTHLAAALDVRNGQVAVEGWKKNLPVRAAELGKELAGIGIETLIYTDISRDGMGCGVNIEAAAALAAETGTHIIVSGGLSSPSDVASARQAGMAGVIIGKALYEGRISLRDAMEVEGAG